MTIKLTREEAIQDLKAIKSFERYARGRLALDMAIEALEGVCFDEWCTDCKEYDTEKKCCPRFNKVIREAMKRIPHDDGTLEVKVEDATKIGRVLISDDKHRGGLYYPDEDEQYKKGFEDAKRAFLVEYARESENMRKRNAQLEVMLNAQKAISADRSRGEWVPVSERLPSEDGKYLVFYAGTIIGSIIEVMRYGEPLMPNVDVSGKHFYRSDNEWGDIVYDEIVAWMPLPEPYKGGADMRGDTE